MVGDGVLRVDPTTDGSDPTVVADVGMTPDYHLESNSPAIDAGVSITAKFLNDVDRDGEVRPIAEDIVRDIGVDEYRDVNGPNDGDGVPD